MAICSHRCCNESTSLPEPPCSGKLMPGRQKSSLLQLRQPSSPSIAASQAASADSTDDTFMAADGDAALDPARQLVQNISWDASSLASDSIHSQRDTRHSSVSLTEPSASSTAIINSAAANAATLASEDRSRPLKKRRTALSPPSPPASGGPEDLSFSASVDGPDSDGVGRAMSHKQPELSDEDSVEPRLSAMEVMHGQWVGADAQPPPRAVSDRLIAAPFPGHHSVSCMHPEGDLDYAHSVSVQKPAAQKTEEGTTRWSGKVKHRLGDSTVELFYLSALVPADVAEQMPTTLFVTELAPRSSLKLHAEHRVLRCRLDFLTDRQLHKLRMLAGLKLAAVSQLQHCAVAMVPYLDAQRHLRIIGVLLNSSR